jgi:hypothetical protein
MFAGYFAAAHLARPVSMESFPVQNHGVRRRLLLPKGAPGLQRTPYEACESKDVVA